MSHDKAVSTEDLCTSEEQNNGNTILGALRLEAILNTLVENKVEALKNDNRRSFSVSSSPRKLLEKLRSPKSSVKVENERAHDGKRRKRLHHRQGFEERHQFKRQVLRQEISVSSPDSQEVVPQRSNYNGQLAMQYDACAYASCHSLPERSRNECCCAEGSSGAINMRFVEDYISVKMGSYGEMETDEMISEEMMRRARRKRRRRRKSRMKRSMALHPHMMHHQVSIDRETMKHYEADDLPPRAKWTIVATACLLLFMCLLLVGITLRMAPLIDEIVCEMCERGNHLMAANCKRPRRSRSLEDLDRYDRRRSRNNRRRQSVHAVSTSRKHSKRRGSHHSRRESRVSYISKNSDTSLLDVERRRSSQLSYSTHDNRIFCSLIEREMTKKQKKRKRIVNTIVAIFFMLFCVSILAVIVTLTHQTTTTVQENNSTKNLTYYTFSPHPDMLRAKLI